MLAWRVVRREYNIILSDLWQRDTLIELMDCLLGSLEVCFLFREKLCWRHLPLIFRSYILIDRVKFVFIGLAGDTLILLQIDLLRVFWLFKFIIIWVICCVKIGFDSKLAFESFPKLLKFGSKLRHFHRWSDSFFFDRRFICMLGDHLALIVYTSSVLLSRLILMLFLYVLFPFLERT
jgi:hypothetical protein